MGRLLVVVPKEAGPGELLENHRQRCQEEAIRRSSVVENERPSALPASGSVLLLSGWPCVVAHP